MKRDGCLSCGACCAHYRVSFYWAEAQPFTPQGVPADLVEKISPHRVAMKGTNRHRPRCVALVGEVGEAVYCSIYPQRPSTCRNLTPSSSHDGRSERCDRARAIWNLHPLSEEHDGEA